MNRIVTERLFPSNRSKALNSPTSSSKIRIQTDTSTIDFPASNRHFHTRTKFEKLLTPIKNSNLVTTQEIQKINQIRSFPNKTNFYMDFKRQTSSKAFPKFENSLLILNDQFKQSLLKQPQFIKQSYERKDAQKLQQWLEEMMTQAKELNSELPFISYYMDLAGIYSGAISEIVRQVQLYSKDLGGLLQQIWDEHMQTVVGYIKTIESENSNFDLQSIQDVSKVHHMYQSLLEKINAKQKEMKNFEEGLQSHISIIKRENFYLKRKELRRERELNQLRQQCDQMLEKISEKKIKNSPFKLLSSTKHVDIKEVEEGEALRQLDCNDFYEEVIFQDKSTDTGDLAPLVDNFCDTDDLIRVKNKEVQAVTTITSNSIFVQATEKMSDKITQFDFKILQQGEEQVPINNIKYLNLIDNANKFTIQQLIDSMEQVCFPEAIDERFESQVPDILAFQTTLFQDNVKQLFLYFLHKEIIVQSDILDLSDYNAKTVAQVVKFFKLSWQLIERYQLKYQDQCIEAYEKALDHQILSLKLKDNILLYHKLLSRYKKQKKIIEFLNQKKEKNRLTTADSRFKAQPRQSFIIYETKLKSSKSIQRKSQLFEFEKNS